MRNTEKMLFSILKDARQMDDCLQSMALGRYTVDNVALPPELSSSVGRRPPECYPAAGLVASSLTTKEDSSELPGMTVSSCGLLTAGKNEEGTAADAGDSCELVEENCILESGNHSDSCSCCSSCSSSCSCSSANSKSLSNRAKDFVSGSLSRVKKPRKGRLKENRRWKNVSAASNDKTPDSRMYSNNENCSIGSILTEVAKVLDTDLQT